MNLESLIKQEIKAYRQAVNNLPRKDTSNRALWTAIAAAFEGVLAQYDWHVSQSDEEDE